MHPQYLAAQSSCSPAFDAGESQTYGARTVSYLLHRHSCSFPQGYTQVTDPQKVGEIRHSAGQARVENRDRRLTCRRASRAFSQCPCWPSWQHVAARTTQVTLKNSWSLTRFRLPLNRRSRANTTKFDLTIKGQASAPVRPCCGPTLGGDA